MGMYTELHYNTELKRDVPENVLDLLRFMLGKIEQSPETPEHALFDTDRWTHMLRHDSYYFDADTHSTLRYDQIAEGYFLCIRCNLKNYDQEIEKFIEWIRPYIAGLDGDFLGFMRYEETEDPVLIYA